MHEGCVGMLVRSLREEAQLGHRKRSFEKGGSTVRGGEFVHGCAEASGEPLQEHISHLQSELGWRTL